MSSLNITNMIIPILVLALCFSPIQSEISDHNYEDTELEDSGRTIILTTATDFNEIFPTLNNTATATIIPALLLFSIGAIPVIGIAIVAVIAVVVLYAHHGNGFHRSGGHDSHSSYLDYSRSFNHNSLDWDMPSILDWISMGGSEAYQDIDSSRNSDCQKRLVCEMYEDREHFGFLTERVSKALWFMPYFQISSFPESLQSYVKEWSEAAALGRTKNQDCRQIYPECVFSVKSIVERYLN